MLKLELGGQGEVSDMLDIVSSSAEQAGELATQLLAFAHGGRYRPQLVRLSDVVDRVIQLQRRSVPPDIDVNLHAAPDLWEVHADPTQMSQVVLNLLANAIEAIGDRGAVVVRAENVTVDQPLAEQHSELHTGPYVCLTVEDSGCGMSAETVARAFEPFFTTKFQGRGMGLAAVHGIVHNHGGAIIVASELGKSSTFSVYLPAVGTSTVS
jgi:signal transduction histidine kinase